MHAISRHPWAVRLCFALQLLAACSRPLPGCQNVMEDEAFSFATINSSTAHPIRLFMLNCEAIAQGTEKIPEFAIFNNDFDFSIMNYIRRKWSVRVIAEFKAAKTPVTSQQWLLQTKSKRMFFLTIVFRRPMFIDAKQHLLISRHGDFKGERLDLLRICEPFSVEKRALRKFEYHALSSDDRKAPNCRQIFSCNQYMAREFRETYDEDTASSKDFSAVGMKILQLAQQALDSLHVPFWMNSGTLLGWYRQCTLFESVKDVDIGIFISDYTSSIVPAMMAKGFTLSHRFGKLTDGFELSFKLDGIKLDMFFFDNDDTTGGYWNGGTQARTGMKLKYSFAKFQLCWAYFSGLTIRVPCDTQQYLQQLYGPLWYKPVSTFDWKSSPFNVAKNGQIASICNDAVELLLKHADDREMGCSDPFDLGYWDRSEWNTTILCENCRYRLL